jgi:hypothetical protein
MKTADKKGSPDAMVCTRCGFEIADAVYVRFPVEGKGPQHARPCPTTPPTQKDFDNARRYLQFMAGGMF